MNEENVTLGSYLRQEREKKNISLEAISRATKITLKNLAAMERDEFHLLPPPVFVRGFLRAYANYIGLDPQKVLEMYAAQTKPVDSSPRIKKSSPVKRFPQLAKIILIFLGIILVVILLFTWSNTNSPPPPSPPTPPTAAQVSPEKKEEASPPEEPLPKSSPGEEKKIETIPSLPSTANIIEKTTVSAPAEKKKERRHVLKVKAKEKTWLRLKADDEREIEALLQPKEVVTWTARRQFKVTLGNAGGVEVTFNGIPQGRLGDSGQVVHLHWPPEVKKIEAADKKD